MDQNQPTPPDDSSVPAQDNSPADQEPLATIDLPADLPDLQNLPDSGTITFKYSKVPADDGSGSTSLDLTAIVNVAESDDGDGDESQTPSQAFDQTAKSVMAKKGKAINQDSDSGY